MDTHTHPIKLSTSNVWLHTPGYKAHSAICSFLLSRPSDYPNQDLDPQSTLARASLPIPPLILQLGKHSRKMRQPPPFSLYTPHFTPLPDELSQSCFTPCQLCSKACSSSPTLGESQLTGLPFVPCKNTPRLSSLHLCSHCSLLEEASQPPQSLWLLF